MKKPRNIQLIGFVLATAAFTSVHAQDQKPSTFLGPAIGAYTSSMQTSFSYNGNAQDLGSKNEVAGGVNASWGFELAPKWVLTAGIAYTRDNVKLATQDVINISSPPPRLEKLTLDAKNDWSLSIAPGYRITDNQLAYAKLSYHTMDIEATSDIQQATLKQTIEVPGIGLGYAFAITPHFQLQGEYESITYSRSGLTKASQDVWSLGVAYRF